MGRRKAVKLNPSGPGLAARLAGLLRHLRRPFLAGALPTLALLAVCWLGLRWAHCRVATSPKYRAAAPRLTYKGRVPKWWEPAFEGQINRSVAFAEGVSILDKDLVKKLAAAYRTCPWVKDVRFVAKRYPRKIEADMDLRIPAAAVAWHTGGRVRYHLVGEDGIRLPKSYSRWPRPELHVPFIYGVAAKPPAPGAAWGERSVTDAIAIVKLVKERPVIRRSLNITAVDVRNYRGRRDRTQSEFRLHAEGNCVIDWGRAPGTGRPGELPVTEKIAKLERFLLDGNPTSNRALDLRFAGRVVTSRRLAADGHSG